MSYSVNKLKTVAECDKSIAIATDRKNELLFEQTVSAKDLSDTEKTVDYVNSSLLSVKAQITGSEAAIEAMPDGPFKTKEVSKLRRLNDRKDNLEDRLQQGGAALLLDTELDEVLLQLQLTEIDAYIAAINTKKASL